MKAGDYETIGKLGEGAFGEVFRARHCKSGQPVALKRIRLRSPQEGLPKNLLREIQALRSVDHPNVIHLYDYFAHGSSIVLTFEIMETDLGRLVKCLGEKGQSLSVAAVKAIMTMMLRGLEAVHDANVLHRDLKPANVLFSAQGEVKLADFGLARVFDPQDKDATYSHQVATRWYRAPELLFGGRKYGTGVDMWAVGCILAELLIQWPLFPGENDIDQLFLVHRGLGSPCTTDWPELQHLPDFEKITFPDFAPKPFNVLLPDCPSDAMAMLQRLLVYNPSQRLTAKEMLKDDYFTTRPFALHSSELVELIQLCRTPKQSDQEKRSRPKPKPPDVCAPLTMGF